MLTRVTRVEGRRSRHLFRYYTCQDIINTFYFSPLVYAVVKRKYTHQYLISRAYLSNKVTCLYAIV